MSKKAAEHHRKAAEHATHAARHHGEAAKHHRKELTKRRPTMHTQREPTSFTPEATLKSQQRLTPRSTARNSIVAAGI